MDANFTAQLISALALPIALGIVMLASMGLEKLVDYLKERKYKKQRRLVIGRTA